MLAQSLFALAVPAAPQAGDAPAAPADCAFGRLVDMATRAVEADGPAPTGGPAAPASTKAPTDETGPQILPGVDHPPATPKHAGPPRPEVLPVDVGPTDDATPGPGILPTESDQGGGQGPAFDPKAAGKDGGARPEVLPRDVGPDSPPRPEILPVDVGPVPQGSARSVAPEPLPTAPAPAAAVAAGALQTAVRPADADATPAGGGEPLSDPGGPAAEAPVPPPPSAADAATSTPQPARPAGTQASPGAAAAEAARFDAPAPGPGAESAPASTPDAAAPSAEAPAFSLSRVAHETLADLSAQIVKRLEGKYTRFEMALTPEDLGRVDVSLEMGEDGSLTARLAFDTPAAAAEMRAQVDQLRRQLEQAGFQLARDALEFSHRDGSAQQRQDHFERRQNRAFAAARDLADRTEAAPLINLSLSLGSARDRVDVKV